MSTPCEMPLAWLKTWPIYQLSSVLEIPTNIKHQQAWCLSDLMLRLDGPCPVPPHPTVPHLISFKSHKAHSGWRINIHIHSHSCAHTHMHTLLRWTSICCHGNKVRETTFKETTKWQRGKTGLGRAELVINNRIKGKTKKLKWKSSNRTFSFKLSTEITCIPKNKCEA